MSGPAAVAAKVGRLKLAITSTTRTTLPKVIKSTGAGPTIGPIRHRVTTATGGFAPEPTKDQLGLVGITGTVLTGLVVGATFSKNMASFLEENDLFVPADDDDDD